MYNYLIRERKDKALKIIEEEKLEEERKKKLLESSGESSSDGRFEFARELDNCDDQD